MIMPSTIRRYNIRFYLHFFFRVKSSCTWPFYMFQGLAEFVEVCSSVCCKHLMLLCSLEKKDGGTHNFQGRHSCIFFTYLALPSEQSFVLVAAWTCALLYNAGAWKLFPLMVALLLFTEHLVWLPCSLRAGVEGHSQGHPEGQQGSATPVNCPASGQFQVSRAVGRSGVKSRALSVGQSPNLV